MMQVDAYTLQARIVPAVVSALPLFALWYGIAEDPALAGLGAHVLETRIAGTVTVSVVLLIVFAHLVRQAGLWLERRLFADGMPSTYLFLDPSPFSEPVRERYRDQVAVDFGIALLSSEEARQRPAEARARLEDAARLVLKRVGRAPLVHKHNIWYGLYRNLAGGAYWGLGFSLFTAAVSVAWLHDTPTLVTAALAAIIHGGFILFAKRLVVPAGEAFAQQLVHTYLARTPDGRGA